ncbi:MAG: CHAT domain-containing protein [Acidimicrobiia bacterium]
MTRSSAEILGQRAVDLVQAEPLEAERLAKVVLAEASASLESQATARWALGLVDRERDHLVEAKMHFEHALRLAREASKRTLAARILSSQALALAYLGDHEGALVVSERAATSLRGVDAARNRMQQGLILQRTGDFHRALDAYRIALSGLRRAGDEIAEVRLRLNRSVIHTYRGDLGLALADLERAMAIARRNEQYLQVAACSHNLGWVHGRRGDIPKALEMFDLAEAAYLEVETGAGRPAVLAIDRAEVLAAAGLLEEAQEQALAGVATLSAGDNALDLAEARLLAARIAIAREDTESARRLALAAEAAFRQQGRSGWELQAQWLLQRAGVPSGDGVLALERSEALVARLRNLGWDVEAAQAEFETGRLAIAVGNHPLGNRLLEETIAHSRKGTVVARAQGHHASALLAMSLGDRKGAKAAIGRALRLLVEYRSTFGSAELRAQATTASRAIAGLSLSLAMDTGRAWGVMTAVDSWRAIAMQLPAVRPPRDRDLADLLTALRRLEAEVAEATAQAKPTATLHAERAELERSIRYRALRTRGEGQFEPVRLDRKELADRLGDTALVAFFEYRGDLGAVNMTGGRLRTAILGSLPPLVEDVQSSVFALNRLAVGRGSVASLEAAAGLLDGGGKSLSRRLIEPMPELGNRPLVIVPTGILHRLPWSTLPALRSRPVTVAPSIAVWMRASSHWTRIGADSQALLACGPGLEGANREVRVLARRYRNHKLLTGNRATGKALADGLRGAEIAHVAAHGTFRTDNPLFSSLAMADGPLTVYDLEEIRRPPRLMVLPACDVAVSNVLVGDELLGLATALLRLGSSSLVAPVVPVPDGATFDLMQAFHRELLRGSKPSEALAVVTDVATATGPAALAARSAFVALGAG